jgi:uncharacterized protein YkwD/uncharacterized membrane protein required for colicin V production
MTGMLDWAGWLDWLRAINPVDLVLGAVVLLGIVVGWSRGFTAAGLQLLSLAGSVALALLGYGYPAAWLEPYRAALGPWIAPLSFLAVFIVAQLILGAISAAIVRAIPVHVHRHGISRALGMVVGAIAGLINATVISLLLLTVPVLDGLTAVARGSAIANWLSVPAEWIEGKLPPIFRPDIRRTLLVQLDADRSIQLPFKVANPKPRPDLEARMLEMLNAERAQRGLGPVRADPELAEVARAHSRDMFARGYFSHVAPDRRDPFDRMRAAKVRYLIAGENLALAHTLAAAHRGLMESPGHRANILRPQFGRVGIAVVDGGMHGLMVTQNFRN